MFLCILKKLDAVKSYTWVFNTFVDYLNTLSIVGLAEIRGKFLFCIFFLNNITIKILQDKKW